MNDIDFKLICDNLIDAMYVTDGSGNTLFVNDAYLKLGNLSRDEVVGHNIFAMNQDHHVYSNGVLPDVLSSRKKCEKIGTLTKTNKKVHVTGIPILDHNGHIKYAVALEKDIERLEELNENLAQLRKDYSKGNAELEYLRQQQIKDNNVIAESQSMKEAFAIVKAIASTDVTVFITGESGTGKEIIADSIYKESTRNTRPFIKLNCSAIPANLLESELFGYEEGTFTGALKGGKAGLFEIASGGTVLMDEIGDMPMELQAKLLRVLQNKEITRLGGKAPIKLDIRLIASTNKDLKNAISQGTFREDLYYRLNVVPIYLHPLKERIADIEPLVDTFLNTYNTKYEKKVIITKEALSLMLGYPWPGNIRELNNVIERMVVTNITGVIDGIIVSRILDIGQTSIPQQPNSTNTLKAATESVEISMIKSALEKHGTKRKAASALGIDHSTLVKKCQKYKI